jgi:ABC-2 type transport system ATP-binding protein
MTLSRSSGAAVIAAGLRKSYGDRETVAGIDLTIEPGEVFTILGPNGAGKTTTVEILEGYRSRTAGTVSVLGEDPQRAGRTWRNRIGMVAQTASDHDAWRVQELVDQISYCYSNPMATSAVLDLVNLHPQRRSLLRTLSGGQRRRLDLALGIVGRPELLFLDEPSTGLDPEARHECWSLIQRLQSAGTTIVLTTHYLDEAERLADRVAVMAAGRFVQVARPSEIGDAGAGAEVRWREDGRLQVVTTTDVNGEIERLRSRLGDDVADLEIRRPTLESRYLRLLGIEPAGETHREAREIAS